MIAFEVNDMTCGHCVGTIKQALKDVDPAADVRVELPAKRVVVESSQAGAPLLEAAIRQAGFTPRAIDAVLAFSQAAVRPKTGSCCCG
jgi:copper chaperone